MLQKFYCKNRQMSNVFKKTYVDIHKNNPNLLKYLASNQNIMFNWMQDFNEKKILRSTFRSEISLNMFFSKFNSSHIFFNYATNIQKRPDYSYYALAQHFKQSKNELKTFNNGNLHGNAARLKPNLIAFKNTNQILKKFSAPSVLIEKNEKDKINTFEIGKEQHPELMSADWMLQNVVQQLNNKRSPRAAINNLIRIAGAFMTNLGSKCPLLGLRVVATGRLGSQKKAMSQQIIKSIGKVPLTTLDQKIDYAQHFVSTRRGLIGLKIWICYK